MELAMLDMIRETQTKFEEIALLLDQAASKNSEYFATLNEATQEAYVTMNEDMCESSDICHECAKHRDFLQKIIPVLEDLKEGTVLTDEFSRQLKEYREIINDILSRISSVLAAR
jgi:hypothetical protein